MNILIGVFRRQFFCRKRETKKKKMKNLQKALDRTMVLECYLFFFTFCNEFCEGPKFVFESHACYGIIDEAFFFL